MSASRMESTGHPNKIQLSKATANLLLASGKEHWIKPRKDAVKAKGKGLLQTFWIASSKIQVDLSTDDVKLTTEGDVGGESDADNSGNFDVEAEGLIKQDRLIDWMVDLLLSRIQILVRRPTYITQELCTFSH
jgi:Adenylate and Guanylate cyclase catalytic domain